MSVPFNPSSVIDTATPILQLRKQKLRLSYYHSQEGRKEEFFQNCTEYFGQLLKENSQLYYNDDNYIYIPCEYYRSFLQHSDSIIECCLYLPSFCSNAPCPPPPDSHTTTHNVFVAPFTQCPSEESTQENRTLATKSRGLFSYF